VKPFRIAGLVFIAAFAATACADNAFSVQYAPDYRPGAANISFFGVYQDGRVNGSSWDQFGTRFTHSFVGAPCEVMYSEGLAAQNPELANAIDSYARNDGVTDDLLEKIAPMAKGDLIGVISISGHPPQPLPDAGKVAPAAPTRNYGGGGKRGGGLGNMGGGGGGSSYVETPTDHNVFEIAATLYSVKAKQSVGVVAMAYTGSSVNDALEKFTAKFQIETAGSRCSGWSWDVKIDPETIRQMAER
jgi:hypothetical protein